MKRYLGVWSSANSPSMAEVRHLTALNGSVAMRIVLRELQFRRTYSRHGEQWDTWAVLFQYDKTSEPVELHAGQWGDQ